MVVLELKGVSTLIIAVNQSETRLDLKLSNLMH